MSKYTVAIIRKNIEANSHGEALDKTKRELANNLIPFTDGISDITFTVNYQNSDKASLELR